MAPFFYIGNKVMLTLGWRAFQVFWNYKGKGGFDQKG